jgi:hypothetical protein
MLLELGLPPSLLSLLLPPSLVDFQEPEGERPLSPRVNPSRGQGASMHILLREALDKIAEIAKLFGLVR